ncbi:MAG: Hsp70 family protein [Dehalococcoidia bacterium]|nr:Hsp70 family protein [Dehalococcoidia bacterium]
MVRAVGIDLGTTYTVVATIRDGRPTIVPNGEGHDLTPSVVGFPKGEKPLVGQAAVAFAAENAGRTVFSVKRRMGSNKKIAVADAEYTPQGISSLILRKVVADAEEYLGEGISQAVITVPAYFNDRQREATKQAAMLAGLDVARIINEPTAAALAYGLEREEAHTILVWDLGGGTFDVSILELGEGIFEVRSVGGDNWLGGDDFTTRATEQLLEDYCKAFGTDFPQEVGARWSLRELAEKAKLQLSSRPVTEVRLPVPDQQGSGYLAVQLTREQLESLTADLLQRMVVPTRQALEDAGLRPADIDRVLLVGGATRTPAVRALARELLGKEPYRYVDPDRVVAMGAAIEAGVLLGTIEKIVLIDVLPLTLGIETLGGLMGRIIARNTALPASGGRLFTTAADYQTSMDIHVLQGERELALDNVSLGRFQLSGIPSAPKGVPKVEVVFEADVDGMVHISATELLDGSEVQVRLASTKLLDPEEIACMVQDAQQRALEDRRERERIQASIKARNLLAAAEIAWKADCGPNGKLLAQRLTQVSTKLEETLTRGVVEEIEALSKELRDALSASSLTKS